MIATRTVWPALIAAVLAAVGVASAQQIGGASSQQCATCHLQWVEDFQRPQPGAVLLMDKPADMAVAEEGTCLGCHDGSVADSRQRVWQEHGHRTGVAVPAGMNVPRILPLSDGKVVCGTCHTAHNQPPREDPADVVFMRVDNDRGQLCTMCHTGQGGGPEHGSHPLGPMEKPVPALLTSAGGKAGPDGRSMNCQTCHSPHGGGEDHLLIVDASDNDLCVSCHGKFADQNWRPGMADHPQSPPLSDPAQRRAIEKMGTRVGPAGTLVCLSCHKMHDGKARRAMLADSLHDSRLCINCHPGRDAMFGTSHDLRTNAPNERNLRGETVSESGPCGACHTFHSFARRPDVQRNDPTGLCTTCHGEGRVAGGAGAAFSHPTEIGRAAAGAAGLPLYADAAHGGDPSIACLSCHDPHTPRNANFLRRKPDDLCGQCHADQKRSMAGAHDFATRPKLKNGRGRTAADTGTCGFCHAVHRANGPALWAATADAPMSPDAMCIACHQAGGSAADKPESLLRHPTGPETAGVMQVLPATRLPLYDKSGHRDDAGFVACGSCHDVHGNSKASPDLLRTAAAAELCTSCHAEQGFLAAGPHGATAAGAKGFPDAAAQAGDRCLSCHQAHSNDRVRGLWTFPNAGGDAVCATCHADHGWAGQGKPAAGQSMHPRDLGEAHTPSVAGLPVRVVDGKGEMLCKTCHNPHAPKGTPGMLRVGGSLDATTLCSRCHGETRGLSQSGHRPEKLATPDGGAVATCGPCHSVHAVETSQPGTLWALEVKEVKVPRMEFTHADRQCLTCHGPTGSATRPALVDHPKVALPKGAGAGGITCQTCHLPHGRTDFAPPTGGQSEARRDALKPMLRPDAVAEACAVCHGPDALRRYLYYHQPSKRKRTHFWVTPEPGKR